MHVFHYSVQVDGLDLSVAHSMYGVSGAFSQQAQENKVMIRETVVFSMGVLYNCVITTFDYYAVLLFRLVHLCQLAN